MSLFSYFLKRIYSLQSWWSLLPSSCTTTINDSLFLAISTEILFEDYLLHWNKSRCLRHYLHWARLSHKRCPNNHSTRWLSSTDVSEQGLARAEGWSEDKGVWAGLFLGIHLTNCISTRSYETLVEDNPLHPCKLSILEELTDTNITARLQCQDKLALEVLTVVWRAGESYPNGEGKILQQQTHPYICIYCL